MKRVVPVTVGLAAGMAVGFFLGVMVTRHNGLAVAILNATDEAIERVMVTQRDRPMVVIHNATDETLRSVSFQTDFHPTLIRRIPASEGYSIERLEPHQTSTIRLSSDRPTGFKVNASTEGGRKLSSEKVNVASQGVVFASVSSDGITLQQYER